MRPERPLLLAWVFERAKPLRIAALAVMTLAAASLLDPQRTAAGGLVLLAGTFAVLTAWRLIDDLADRAIDRIHPPLRALALASRIPSTVYAGAASSLLVGCALLAFDGLHGPVAIVLITAALLGWYRLRPASRLANAHVVLLKYPAAATALSDGRGLLGPAALYFALCAYELLEDGRLRGTPPARGLAIAHLGAVGALWVAAGRGAPTAALILSSAGCVALGVTAWRTRGCDRAPRAAWLPLVAAAALFVQLLPWSPP